MYSDEVSNRLIAGLPPPERQRLLANCALIKLTFGEVICRQHEPFSHAYFPVTASISLLASIKGHPAMEIGMIGSEGMQGVTLLLDVNQAPQNAIVQKSGNALRIAGPALRDLLTDSPMLKRALQGYFYQLMTQITQTTVCTRFHQVEARLARWLLMSHDRAQSDQFHLTHQMLANMLGVQRSAVTIASGALKNGLLIDYARGRISILDRAGLEAAACECYAAEQLGLPTREHDDDNGL